MGTVTFKTSANGFFSFQTFNFLYLINIMWKVKCALKVSLKIFLKFVQMSMPLDPFNCVCFFLTMQCSHLFLHITCLNPCICHTCEFYQITLFKLVI